MNAPARSGGGRRSSSREGRAAVHRGLILAVLLLHGFAAAAAQDPEIIVLDPNHPMIQDPGTVQPGDPAPGGQEPAAEVLSPLEPAVDMREVLAEAWFRYRVLGESGNDEEAARHLETVLGFMARDGLRAAPELAAALHMDGRRALDDRQYHRALTVFEMAARFDPALAAAHDGAASARLRGDRDVTGALASLLRGLRARLGDSATLYVLLADACLVVFAGAAAGVVLAFAFAGLRHAPSFFHDVQERSGARLSEEAARLVGSALLALPCLAFLPAPWVLAVWVVLLAPYLRGRARVLPIALLILMLFSGPVGMLLRRGFGTASDPQARALVASTRGGYTLAEEEGLRSLATAHPDEALFPFLLGGIERAAGREERAMQQYRRALEIDPRHARAMVNLANLRVLRQEFALAQNLYKKAAEIDPELVLAHYNSHLAYLETFQMEAADAALRAARDRDAGLVARLLAESGGGEERRTPLDTRCSAAELWARALRLDTSGGGDLARSFRQTTSLAGAAGLVGVLALPGLGMAPRRSSARRCQRCGRPFCRHCQSVGRHPEVCSQCLHLFILRDGLAPAIKARKLRDVARNQRRVWIRERIVSLFLPGGGHVLGGRALSGTVLLFVWCTMWIGLLLWGRLLVMPGWLAAAGARSVLPLVAAGTLAWLSANLTARERTGD